MEVNVQEGHAMKVNNNRDSVELSQTSRSKRGEKAGAAKKSEEGAGATGTGAAGGAGATANVEISSEAKSIAAASQAAKAADTDEAKIARIKAMINGGTYKPDYGKVADKMVNETLLQDLSN
jgi:negative regulator of flagellin synthesis FlgM